MLKNRKGLVAVLLAVFVVGTIIGLLCARPGLAADPVAPKQLVKWEYSTLGRDTFAGRLRIATAEKTVDAETIEELSQKFGGKNERRWVALANALGAQGWELVAVGTDSVANGTFPECYFRRPAN